MRQFIPLILLSFILGQATPILAQEAPDVYPYAYQDTWGIVDENRTVVLAPSVDTIGFFTRLSEDATHTKLAIARQGNSMGILNQSGQWMLKPKYEEVGDWDYYARDVRWIKHKGKFGLMSFSGKKGKWLIKPRFTTVDEFHGRKLALAIVAIDDQYGVVNNQGDIVAKCEYDAVKMLDDYSDYPDVKLTKNGEDQYLDAFGAVLPTEEMREKEEREDMWDDDVVFEDNSIEEEASQHRTRTEYTQQGQQKVILEQSSRRSPWTTIEERTVPAGYSIAEIKVQERYMPLRLNAVVLMKDGQISFLGEEGILNEGATYDRLSWKRSARYDELGLVYRADRLGVVNRDGREMVPPAFSEIEEYGTLFRLVHPDGYRGFASSQGKVFLPMDVNLGQ